MGVRCVPLATSTIFFCLTWKESSRMALPAWLRAWPPRPGETTSRGSPQPPLCGRPLNLLVVVEGPHDIAFFRRMSAILAAADPRLPDLTGMERRGQLVFIPFGGGDLGPWADRLAPLGLPEFHLYDREASPESERRQRVADAVNRRPHCRAALTGKRSLENYLHPAAIQEACGIELAISDDELVADRVAERLYGREDGIPWAELPRRTVVRRRNRVKRMLHTQAVERMTPQRLAERDPQGEVRLWLEAIAHLAGRPPRSHPGG